MLQKIKSLLRPAYKALKYAGRERYCPICEHHASRFGPYGLARRQDAQCFWCGSLERQRFAWLFLQRKTDFFSGRPGRDMLHITPDACLEPKFRRAIGQGYVTGDLFAESADVRLDVCDIQYGDETFDIVYCSHVLEYVEDDGKAIGELQRVLKSTGWAMIMEPVAMEKTVQAGSELEPAERARLFLDKGHRRRLGKDLEDRLRVRGLEATQVVADGLVSAEDQLRMGITSNLGQVFFCRKLVRS